MLIMSGIVEQSRISCIISDSLLLDRTESMIVAKCTLSLETLLHSSNSLARVWDRAGQWSRRCSSDPSAGGEQVGRRHRPALFKAQCLWSLSVKYLPESMQEAS